MARLAVAAGAAVGLAACGSPGGPALVYRGNVEAVQPGSLSAADVARAQTAFGVDLLHALCDRPEPRAASDNVLLSSTSAAEALSLLYPAAGGATASALAKLLHLPAWSPQLVAAMREHTGALDRLRSAGDPRRDGAPDFLQLSNRLWTARGVQPGQRYLDDLATAFDADIGALDFAGDPGGATDRINATVSDDTHRLIERLFDQPLDRSTRAVLTNALYLKARWAQPFTSTAPTTFTTPSGVRTVDMMSGGSGTSRAAGGWLAVELPYRDGTLAAVAILPPQGVDPCAVDAPMLAALDAAHPDGVDVRLPRMTFQQTRGLLEPLTSLGLPPVGTFPGLGAGEQQISQVVQKTYLKVDQQGTEAAAATGVAVATSARVAQRVVSFDRPFLFLLTDTSTRSPLFTAAVYNPAT